MTNVVTIHLVKLCVGIHSADELIAWDTAEIAAQKAAGIKPELMHVTRLMPKRAEELIRDGSMYWVIKGHIQVRQRILDLRPVTREDGKNGCGIVLSPEIIRTEHRFYDPFQGWRYLKAEDAPRDADEISGGNMPDDLKIELADLGLL